MAIADLNDLLVSELMSIRDAEEQAATALAAQLDEIDDEDVEELLEARLEAGERLKRVLESALQHLGAKPEGVGNEAARGIIAAMEGMLGEAETPELRMAVLIAGVRKLDHYCIASWGAAKALAHEAGETQIVDALQRALDESRDLDEQLAEIAEQGLDLEAAGDEKSVTETRR